MFGRIKQMAASHASSLVVGAARTLHLLSLGAFIALSEDDPLATYMESGPSLFCNCCGERWHAFSHASCPNGCPWVYATFRAPAWTEDKELLRRVQEKHRGRTRGAAEGDDKVHRWPTADGSAPRA